MTTCTLAQLVDAYVARLESVVTLPAHSTWKYLEPRFTRDDKGSQLAVFPTQSVETILATNSSYQVEQTIAVVWSVPTMPGVEGGGLEPALAATALATAEAILTELRTWGVVVPGSPVQNEAEVTTVKFGLAAGVRWAMDARTLLRRWPE